MCDFSRMDPRAKFEALQTSNDRLIADMADSARVNADDTAREEGFAVESERYWQVALDTYNMIADNPSSYGF